MAKARFLFTASGKVAVNPSAAGTSPHSIGLPAHAERAERRLPAAHAGPPVFETGDVQIGQHRRRWLIHASSTATVPPASRVAVGEGWISRTWVRSKTRYSAGSGVVRIRTTPQMKRAMFGSGGTTQVAYLRLVHGDGPPANRVAVGEGWISRTVKSMPMPGTLGRALSPAAPRTTRAFLGQPQRPPQRDCGTGGWPMPVTGSARGY